jgi:hypothetical protein
MEFFLLFGVKTLANNLARNIAEVVGEMNSEVIAFRKILNKFIPVKHNFDVPESIKKFPAVFSARIQSALMGVLVKDP